MGLTIIFSALFSVRKCSFRVVNTSSCSDASQLPNALCLFVQKLWRIYQLFNVASFRRVRITERDVLAPFVALFSVNTALLTSWNIVDPLRSELLVVEDEEWKTYAACRSVSVGYIFMYSVGAVNGAGLLMACWQAYKTRHIRCVLKVLWDRNYCTNFLLTLSCGHCR
jgi:hypothetical protein